MLCLDAYRHQQIWEPRLTMSVYWTAAITSAFMMCVVSAFAVLMSLAILAIVFKLSGRFVPWSRANKIAFGQATFFCIPFAVLGTTVGFVTGLSRETAVGDVLPAFLALVGGVSVYLVSKGGRSAIISAVAVVVLCVALSGGIGYGSRARVQGEEAAASPENQRALANRELNLMRYRESIGLPEKKSN